MRSIDDILDGFKSSTSRVVARGRTPHSNPKPTGHDWREAKAAAALHPDYDHLPRSQRRRLLREAARDAARDRLDELRK